MKENNINQQVIREPIQIHIPIISDKQYSCPYEKPFGYIYKITEKETGNYYIGKHEFHEPYMDKKYFASGSLINAMLDSCLWTKDDFDHIIIDWISEDEGEEVIFEREKYWIYMFGSFLFPQHYNLTEGGDGFTSESVKGENNPMYGDHRWAGENNPMYDVHRPHTEEEKKQHSKTMKEVHKNKPELAINQSKMMKQRNSNEEYKRKVASKLKLYYENNPDARDKMSETLNKITTDRWNSEWGDKQKQKYSKRNRGSGNPMAKKVIRFDDSGNIIKIYDYLAQVQEDGFSTNSVYLCCNNKYKYNGGKYSNNHWMFMNDYKQEVIT